MKITFEPENDAERQHLKGGQTWQGVQDVVALAMLKKNEDDLEPHQFIAVTDDMARAYVIAMLLRVIMRLAEPTMATVVPAKRRRVIVPEMNGGRPIPFPGGKP